MSKQLRLIESETVTWRLDSETKRLGKQGLARARAALRNSRPRYASSDQKAA